MKRIICLLTLTISMGLLAQTVTLKDMSKNGDTYKVKLESLQQSQKMGHMKITYDFDKVITKISENQITSRSEVRRMLVDISQKGATYRYDSKVKNPTTQMGQILKKQFDPMAKVTLITVTDRFGELINIETIPPVQNAALSGFQFFYPKKPVKVGSTWITKMPNAMAGTINLTYTVTKITSTTLYADFKGSSSDLKTMKVDGNVEVDIATGNPEKLVANTKINTNEAGKVNGKTTIISTKN